MFTDSTKARTGQKTIEVQDIDVGKKTFMKSVYFVEDTIAHWRRSFINWSQWRAVQ